MGKKAGAAVSSGVVGTAVGGPVVGAIAAASGRGPDQIFKDPLGVIRDAGDNVSREFKNIGKDPFGAEKIAREQQTAADKAIEDIAGRTVESSGTTTGTSQVEFADKGAREARLGNESVAAFADQQRLVGLQEEGIRGREGVQGAARTGLQDVLSGDAFELSQGEQGRINNLRGAEIDASSFAVNQLLNERLGQVEADAASRGVRGQAFSQLQGDAIGASATELNRATLAANVNANQNAITLPGQRAGVQAQTAGQFAGFADAQQQQVIENKNLLQNPAELARIRDERLKGGKTSTTQEVTSSKGLDPTEAIQARAGLPSTSAAKVNANQQALGTSLDIGTLIAGI